MRFTTVTCFALVAVAGVQASLSAKSKAGQRLLQKARRLDDAYQQYKQNVNYYSNVRDQNWGYGNNRYTYYGAQQYQNQYGDNQNWYQQQYDQQYNGGQQQQYDNGGNWNGGNYDNNGNWYGDGDENDNGEDRNEEGEYYAGNYGNQEANDRDWGNDGQNFDTSWVTGYSIQFDGCSSDYNADAMGQVKTELLAKFKLCPNGNRRCRNGGQYVIPMEDYVDAFKEIVATDENCRMQQETCYNKCLESARYGNAWDDDNNNGAGRRLQNNNYYQYRNDNYANGNYANNNEYQNQNQNRNGNYNANGNYNNNNYNGNDNGNDNGEEEDGNNGNGVSSGFWNLYSYWQSGQYQDGDEDQSQDKDDKNYNNYFDEAYCRYDCMADAGMSYCEENVEQNGANGYNDYDLYDMVQCHQLSYHSAESQPYWVGANCRDGGVYLDVFYDSQCTKAAPSGTHETEVGYSLPQANLVNDEPVACSGAILYINPEYYGDFDNWEEYQEYYEEYADQQMDTAISVCESLYYDAGKCEERMDKENRNNGGCDYIHRMQGSNLFLLALKYIFGIALAVFLVLFAYYIFVKIRKSDSKSLKAMVQRVHAPVSDSVRRVGEALKLVDPPSSAKEPLSPNSDAGSVTSAESSHYEGAKMTVPIPPPSPQKPSTEEA